MTGKQHLKLGFFIGVTGSIAIGEPVSGFSFALGSVIGSLAPDIDSPKSKISQVIPLIPKLVNKIFGHRYLFHSPFLLILLTLLLRPWMMENPMPAFLSYGFLTGYLAHFIQDIFTVGGLPLFFPLSKKKFHIGILKSGSYMDKYTTYVLMGAWFFVSLKIMGLI